MSRTDGTTNTTQLLKAIPILVYLKTWCDPKRMVMGLTNVDQVTK